MGANKNPDRAAFVQRRNRSGPFPGL